MRQFARDLSPDELFKMLESTLLSEIISEVNIRVKVASSDEPLTFRELSEGEQQLLTVLGLLKFTGGKDSLFLLDEPDRACACRIDTYSTCFEMAFFYQSMLL
ncbi:AAA family ATPase [Methylomonas sp. MO1]|uniref:AAA family ATPase n=1 Tax=Methylomonas sp. MO1 TaxID=3073619 RepID=UPI0028A4B5E3|nr:AAA family ATPase [Methylomonas sp. MO1]MDT4289553.1 AAA family ATPase [Methylomonas sp. MO1]